VRFPLRRQQVEELEREPELAPLPEPIPFVTPSAALPTPPAVKCAGNSDLLSADAAAPSPRPFSLPLRSQFTASDSRADRLVRQIRGEVDHLKHTLDNLAHEHDEMVEVDPAAVAANPETAAALPAAVLVRTIITAGAANVRLRKRVAKQGRREASLRQRLNDLKVEDAANRARLDTLEEVLSALNGNLQDLRFERDYQRGLSAAQPVPALRPRTADFPRTGDCDGDA